MAVVEANTAVDESNQKWGICEVKSEVKVKAHEIKKALALINTNAYFLTEVKSGSTFMGTGNRILDAVAVKKSYTNKCIVGYEIKVSRSDFKADNKMFTYLPLVHQLYLVCPRGLITADELPHDIGLIWYNPEKKSLLYKKKVPRREIEISTEMLLYIIYSRLDEDRIPFYNSKAEYFEDWLENKISNHTLGQRVNTELVRRLNALERELEDTRKYGAGSKKEDYDKIIQICIEAGMDKWCDGRQYARVSDWLKERLGREYPKILDTVKNQLEIAMRHIEAEKRACDEG